MQEDLICAFDFDKSGNIQMLAENEIFDVLPKDSWRWVHLDRTGENVKTWLSKDAAISDTALLSLLAEETRPTVQQIDDCYIINLRGVNLNPDASPEDMVSVRIWIENSRIITLRKLRIAAIQKIRDECDNNHAPEDIGDFVIRLVNGLIERMAPVIAALDDTLDELEALQLEVPTVEHRNKLGGLRRQTITLKRFLAPQKEALMNLSQIKASWLDEKDVHALKDAQDQTSRMVEALDAMRERAGLLHEEFSSQLADINNRNSYVLTVIAAIFLPLGLLTGLLGINVGGVPGIENPYAFLWVTIGIIVLGVLEYLLLKFMKWI